MPSIFIHLIVGIIIGYISDKLVMIFVHECLICQLSIILKFIESESYCHFVKTKAFILLYGLYIIGVEHVMTILYRIWGYFHASIFSRIVQKLNVRI